MSGWTKADAWYRRDVGTDSWLTVSRTRSGAWSWRFSRYSAESPVASSQAFDTAGEARTDADASVRFVRPVRQVAA